MAFFCLRLAVLLPLLMACSLDELEEEKSRAGDRISFRATSDGMTKALDMTVANLTAFTVTAFNHGTVDSPYIDGTTFSGSSAAGYQSAYPYYWPKQGALDFYAWSAGSAVGQVVQTDYRTFEITPAATPDAQVDFVYAGTANREKTDPGCVDGAIALNFRHAGAMVNVKVKNTAAHLSFVVDAWRVGYLDDSGTFTYNGNEAHAYDASTDGAGTLDGGMWTNNAAASASNSYTSTLNSSLPVGFRSSTPTQLSGEMVLVPQTTPAATAYAYDDVPAIADPVNGSYVAVKLKITNRSGSIVFYDDGEGGTAWAVWPTGFSWNPGKKYTYTIDLAGGGYYEQNQNEDASLDPILDGTQYRFAGLAIAPGPLYYNGSGYAIYDDWNHSSYNSASGKATNSTYFNFGDMGELFERTDFSTAIDGDIENLLDPFDGWRLPTNAEWSAIIGTSRSGSVVNGDSAHFALVRLSGVFHAGQSNPVGLLLFPDDCDISGATLTNVDVLSGNVDNVTSLGADDLGNYLSQGCAFLPASGARILGVYSNAGENGYYWSSTQLSQLLPTNAYGMKFSVSSRLLGGYSISIDTGDQALKSTYYYSVRLVK